ncbi:MAG: DNA-methyltransferase [Dehalogenimonas sp.]
MSDTSQNGLGDELFGTRLGEARETSGPVKGEFVAPPADTEERVEALPDQEEFWRPPTRFGSIPVEKVPLGWDDRRGFYKNYPQVMLPTQVVERVSFGNKGLEPNRLFWGDNLHVMRQLPSESIDLIYIDPPFFSGKQYNCIFGDLNELRSFSDIWEDGMPGYLVWLNARLYEMKRLLKKTGSIYVHLDWHACHYVKVEMDKIFGSGGSDGNEQGFKAHIIWNYSWGVRTEKKWNRKHDDILFYSKGKQITFNAQEVLEDRQLSESTTKRLEYSGALIRDHNKRGSSEKALPTDVWYIATINGMAKERIGYPTQKPEVLVEKIIRASSNVGDVVADFFCGGGTTPAVAQRLGRRWIASDQSRVAVALTSDRLSKVAEQVPLEQATPSFQVPDFTVEHWGIYEAKRLANTPPEQFMQFVLRAYGAVPDTTEPGIHGHKGAVPIWVGLPSQKSSVTPQEVIDFANAVRKTARYQQDNLRDGIMLAWAFKPEALQVAQKLREQEATDLHFIRLDTVRIDSPQFRQHVSVLDTGKGDYSSFLTFVLPPKVEVGWRKVSGRQYKFDVSETAVLNPGGKIINVQWDFDYDDIFTSTEGYSFIRTSSKAPVLQVEYAFPSSGRYRIACKVQDDIGGEGLWNGYIEVD